MKTAFWDIALLFRLSRQTFQRRVLPPGHRHNGDSTYLWNVSLLQPDYMAPYHLHTRRRENLKSHKLYTMYATLFSISNWSVRLCFLQVSFVWGTGHSFNFIRGSMHKNYESAWSTSYWKYVLDKKTPKLKIALTGGYRNLDSKVLHNLHSLSVIISMITPRRMRWVEHVASMTRWEMHTTFWYANQKARETWEWFAHIWKYLDWSKTQDVMIWPGFS
jgi:hypothetical protein